MANFYKDNEDIQFHLHHTDFTEIVGYYEDGLAQREQHPYAPESVSDAIDSYERVLSMIGELAGDFIAPRAESVDREGNVLKDGRVTYARGISESLQMLSKADLMGFTLPRKYGGLNLPNLIYTMAIEIVSRADASLMNIFGLQGIAETINAFADEGLKNEYLPRFCTGEITGAMALTEPDAGSDLQNVKLKATETANGIWLLNGVKRFITNGCGEVLLVLARSEPDREGGLGLSIFICERSDKVRVRRLEDKLGIHGSPTCELQFNDAPARLIGERQRGLIYGMALMNGARIGIAAQALGIAQAAFNAARAYAYTRQQFGKRIERIPPVADMLTDMRVSIEAARALTYEGSRVVDLEIGMHRRSESDQATDPEERKNLKGHIRSVKRLAAHLTPMAKYYSTEMCNKVASDAIQVLGGSGYMRDYPVERHFRDARITNIYEGTSQLQVVAAVGGVVSGVAEKRFAELGETKYARPLSGLAKKLERARKWLGAAVESAKRGGLEYTDLCARKLVDMATDIMIGYLFLQAATKSKRKAIIAKRFIGQLLPRAKMNHDQIRTGDRSSLKEFGWIVGPPLEVS
ncbi:MAG: acyl-CoA dehydrogenase family protein [Planctomycetota bacterium]